jgi:hypothetical protein
MPWPPLARSQAPQNQGQSSRDTAAVGTAVKSPVALPSVAIGLSCHAEGAAAIVVLTRHHSALQTLGGPPHGLTQALSLRLGSHAPRPRTSGTAGGAEAAAAAAATQLMVRLQSVLKP